MPSPARIDQFNLRTLLAVVAAYAVLFSGLRFLQIRNPWGFAGVVLYVTAVAHGQRSFCGGRRPFGVAIGVTILFGLLYFTVVVGTRPALAAVRDVGDGVVVCFRVIVVSTLLGIFVGGLVAIAARLVRIAGGALRPGRSAPSEDPAASRLHPAVRWIVLLLLAALFVAVAYCGLGLDRHGG